MVDRTVLNIIILVQDPLDRPIWTRELLTLDLLDVHILTNLTLQKGTRFGRFRRANHGRQ